MGNGTRAFAVLAEQPEKDNPLRAAEMTLEDDYDMIDGVILHPGAAGGRKTGMFGAQAPGERMPRPGGPGAWRSMSRSKKWRPEWSFFLDRTGRRKYNKVYLGYAHDCKQSF